MEVGGALCVSLRCSELKRSAASGADEEGARLERSMWTSDRQQQHWSVSVCTYLVSDGVQPASALRVCISGKCGL